MDFKRWEKIEELYRLVREQEPAQREFFLAEACRGDSQLRKEVEALLAQVRQSLQRIRQRGLNPAT